MSRYLKLKLLLLLLLLSAKSFLLEAQDLSLTPFGGFTSKVMNRWSGRDFIYAGPHAGLALDFQLNKNYHLQMIYSRQRTSTEPFPFGRDKKSGIEITRLQLGLSYASMIAKTDFEWMGGLNAGPAIIVNRIDQRSTFRIALDFKTALTWKMTRSVGLMIQAQAMELIRKNAGQGIRLANVRAGNSSTLLQVGVSGGLVLSLGRMKKF